MLRSHMKPPFRSARRSRLFKLNDPRNGARKPAPVICFFFELSPPEPRERIIFCAPTILGRFPFGCDPALLLQLVQRDRKSTRLNSSHGYISYAVFCLKKKKLRSAMSGVSSRVLSTTPS